MWPTPLQISEDTDEGYMRNMLARLGAEIDWMQSSYAMKRGILERVNVAESPLPVLLLNQGCGCLLLRSLGSSSEVECHLQVDGSVG